MRSGSVCGPRFLADVGAAVPGWDLAQGACSVTGIRAAQQDGEIGAAERQRHPAAQLGPPYRPVLFHSTVFLCGFLPLIVAGFFLAARFGRRTAFGLLVLGSLTYYGWWDPVYLFLIVGSIAANFAAGRALQTLRADGRATSGKSLLAAGVAANLLTLGYFKYYNFFIDNIEAILPGLLPYIEIQLPLAISFFTFQQIAYLVDVHRGLAEEHDVLDYALFVTFFPQLIAGPIVHHSQVMPQFRDDRVLRFDPQGFAEGGSIFLLGMFKKVALADNLSVFSEPVFTAAEAGEPVTFFAAWGGAVAYTFQIYFDFSGYSDMAIGLGRMFGIRLPINFDSPYKATNITEFWRRWHMTLSRFLRDYVYFALGGNRAGESRRYINLMATMLVGGLWHGAAWTYVVWGGLHGVYLMIHRFWTRARPRPVDTPPTLVGRVAGWTLTFVALVVAYVVFRSESFGGIWAMLQGMAGINGAPLPVQVVNAVPGLGLLFDGVASVPYLAGGTVIGFISLTGFLALSFVVIMAGQPLHRMSQRSRLVLLVFTVAFTLQTVFFGSATREFIYFQF